MEPSSAERRGSVVPLLMISRRSFTPDEERGRGVGAYLW